MNTLFGDLPEESLHKSVKEEDVPCGRCITTQYFYQGKLARQDCEVVVLHGLSSESTGGKL